MKIGILTITDGANYGNRLQNYAMQELIESLGYEVETIRRLTYRDRTKTDEVKITIKDTIKRFIGKKNTEFSARKRKNRFNEFNKRYIKYSDFCISNNNAPSELNDYYDYFVCGSDQIWNAHFDVVKCDIKNHLAAFADSTKRIAFAASFGTTDVAVGYKKVFEDELKKFKAIAVREDAGRKIVKDLTGRDDVAVVLDPTLLIDRDKWISIEKQPKYIKDEKYIVTYFLGGRSEKINLYIENLSAKNGLKVINLDIEFLRDSQISNGDIFCTTPDEFVWLIHHAECVLTDSFHASVFSIIFEKPFLVFERIAAEKDNDMGSRIDTLLGKFRLNDCKDDIENPTKVPLNHDYSEGYKQLEKERKKAMFFLKKKLLE